MAGRLRSGTQYHPPFVAPAVLIARQIPLTHGAYWGKRVEELPGQLRELVIDNIFDNSNVPALPANGIGIVYRDGETTGTAQSRAGHAGTCIVWTFSQFLRDFMHYDETMYWECVHAIVKREHANILRFHNNRSLYFFLSHIAAAPTHVEIAHRRFGGHKGWLREQVWSILLCRPLGPYYQKALSQLAHCPKVFMLRVYFCRRCRTTVGINRSTDTQWNNLANKVRKNYRTRVHPHVAPGLTINWNALVPMAFPAHNLLLHTNARGQPDYFATFYRPMPRPAQMGHCHPVPHPPHAAVFPSGSQGRQRVRNLPTNIAAQRIQPFGP